MICRKELDIGPAEFALGLLACCGLCPPPDDTDRVGRLTLCARPDSLVCLSVRSAFDLFLSEAHWAPGDEVLVSAVTIPDISRILREHGLRPVPVDIDPATLAPLPAALERAVGPRTRALLVAHLLGSLVPMDDFVAWAHARGLMVLEDCAQSFGAGDAPGHPESDLRFFSFGTIKTATALGGGITLVRDRQLLARMSQRHADWPAQPTSRYARRLLKFAAFCSVQSPLTYGVVFALVRATGNDVDATITDFGRGFAGPDFFPRLRHRPCRALTRLIAWRLATYDARRVAARTQAGERLLHSLRGVSALGAAALRRTHWLVALRLDDPVKVRARLWAHGFDATCATSSLHALLPENDVSAPEATEAMARVLYVPASARMTTRELLLMAEVINRAAG